MKYIKTFENYSENETIDEGVRSWIAGGLMALSTLTSCGNNKTGEPVTGKSSPTEIRSNTKATPQQNFLKLTKVFKNKSTELKQSVDGDYHLIEGSNINGFGKKGTGYSLYNVYVSFGDPNQPNETISIKQNDVGVISIYYGCPSTSDRVIDVLGSQKTKKAGSMVETQFELNEGDLGYHEALEIIKIFKNVK